MGLKQATGGKGRTFLSINGKEGVFYTSAKDEATNKWISTKVAPGSILEGTLVGLETKEDQINGKVVTKGVLVLRDPEPGQPEMQVEFGLWRQSATSADPSVGETSRFGLGILAALNAADVTKPLALRPWFMAMGEKMPDGAPRTSDGAGVTIYQGGEKLAPKFIENGQIVDKLAPLPSQTFGGNTFYDKTGWDKVGQDLFAALEAKLHPADAESFGDNDSISPADAAAAANAEHNRQRA